MNAKFTAIAASLAVTFATGAYAQTSPDTSGASGQGAQPQTRQIVQQHQAAMKECDRMKGNAKDVCEAEADGQKEIAEAQAKVTERDTPKNRLELAEKKAEAEYKVAKARCGDQVGDVKKACENEAKATQDLAKAKAKRQSLAETSSTGSTTSGSSGDQTAPSGAGASGSSAGGQATPPAESSSSGSSAGQTLPPGDSASGGSTGSQVTPPADSTSSGSSGGQTTQPGDSASGSSPEPQPAPGGDSTSGTSAGEVPAPGSAQPTMPPR